MHYVTSLDFIFLHSNFCTLLPFLTIDKNELPFKTLSSKLLRTFVPWLRLQVEKIDLYHGQNGEVPGQVLFYLDFSAESFKGNIFRFLRLPQSPQKYQKNNELFKSIWGAWQLNKTLEFSHGERSVKCALCRDWTGAKYKQTDWVGMQFSWETVFLCHNDVLKYQR